jgi:hypothetical protein
MHNNQADLIFLIETTGFIGVCFDQIKEKYLNPILESLWGYSVKDEIGVINDVSECILLLYFLYLLNYFYRQTDF